MSHLDISSLNEIASENKAAVLVTLDTSQVEIFLYVPDAIVEFANQALTAARIFASVKEEINRLSFAIVSM